MKGMTGAGVVLLLAAAAAGQDGKDNKPADKIGKQKAPAVLAKAVADAQKRKSAAVKENVMLSAPAQTVSSAFEGVLRKDFVAVKGTAEIYAKGGTYLVSSDGAFVAPEGIKGLPGTQAASFKNPALLLADLARAAAAATYDRDLAHEGKDCKVIDLAADVTLRKQYLQELSVRLAGPLKERAGALLAQVDLATLFDEKVSAAWFKVWVGKDDLILHKMEWGFEPRVKQDLPFKVPSFEVSWHTEIKFSEWDREIKLDVPAAVKAKFGIR